MSSIASFKKLMTHTLSLNKKDRNVSGDYETTSSTSLKGFCQYGTHYTTDQKGEDVKATAIIFLKDDCGIDINWPYWSVTQTIPYSRPEMEVIKIDPIDDPRTGKTHHYELAVR